MASSNYQLIMDGIATELEKIPEVGRIHPRPRWAKTWSELVNLFKWVAPDGSDQIRGWMIRRVSADEDLASFSASAPGGTLPMGVSRTIHTFEIFGVMGFNDKDASEDEFQALVERVRDHFRDNNTLRLADAGGVPTIPSLEKLFPPNVAMDLREDGGFVAHTAEIHIRAAERIARDYS